MNIKDEAINTVILVGGYASRCVLSTAVGANGNDLFCVVPKELVVNQMSAAHELDAFYDVINAIFGITLSADEIITALQN
jgi:nicotinamidase-related amidase